MTDLIISERHIHAAIEKLGAIRQKAQNLLADNTLWAPEDGVLLRSSPLQKAMRSLLFAILDTQGEP
jgi:hypothetical protein